MDLIDVVPGVFDQELYSINNQNGLLMYAGFRDTLSIIWFDDTKAV